MTSVVSKPVIFLHIPKTAGQTIHSELVRAIGKSRVSPVRVHTEVAPGAPQMPSGYLLYSGHLDWTELDGMPDDRFVFTVLRDPWERIASFYFYLLDQAQALDPAELTLPHRTGMRMILTHTADDYFFGGDANWQRFVADHYDNFYCSYFATRLMRGRKQIAKLPDAALLEKALDQSRSIDRIYATTDLASLEADVAAELGLQIRVTDRFVNAGPQKRDTLRWPRLLDRLERDDSAARLTRFGELDARLMERLGLPVQG